MLKPSIIYIADNGELICSHCAGHSARTTGRDTSGQRLLAVVGDVAQAWKEMNQSSPIQCEQGCTKVAL